LVYSAFELAEPIELFKEALLEILGIQRQITLATTIAVSLYSVTFPAPNLFTVGLEKSADEGLLLGTLFLSVETYWEALLFDLRCFYVSFEMDSALVIVKPVPLIKLEINPPVIDFPAIVEPSRSSEAFLEVLENEFEVFHLKLVR
tara:strand:- start:2087 stop:2524 length:438 start_codon:yes stop_codon:yes gene_type:complete